jgi:hypothetical protein
VAGIGANSVAGFSFDMRRIRGKYERNSRVHNIRIFVPYKRPALGSGNGIEQLKVNNLHFLTITSISRESFCVKQCFGIHWRIHVPQVTDSLNKSC